MNAAKSSRLAGVMTQVAPQSCLAQSGVPLTLTMTRMPRPAYAPMMRSYAPQFQAPRVGWTPRQYSGVRETVAPAAAAASASAATHGVAVAELAQMRVSE